MHTQTSDAGVPGAQSELALPALFLTAAGIFWTAQGLLSAANTLGIWHLLGQTMPIGQRLAAWLALEQPGRVIELSGLFVMAAMPLTLFVTGVLTGSVAQKLLALLHALAGLALLAIPAQIEYSIAAGVTTTLHLASMLGRV